MSTPLSPELTAKIRSVFPDDFDVVGQLLMLYGDTPYQTAEDRVRFAILKLSGTSLTAIQKYLEVAKADARDVIMLAEYPRESQLPSEVYDAEYSEPLERAKNEDRAEYLTWRNGA